MHPPANFVLVEGLCARHLGRPAEACPYRDGLPRRFWLWGYETAEQRNVPRETAPPQARGQGADYTPGELDLLAYAGEVVPNDILAAMLGRSPASVAVKLARLRKARKAQAA